MWFVSMEKCCHSQLMAEAAAASRGEKPVVIGDEEATYTHRTVRKPQGWLVQREANVRLDPQGDQRRLSAMKRRLFGRVTNARRS